MQGLDNLPTNAEEYKATLGQDTYLFTDVNHFDRRIGNTARGTSQYFGAQRKKLARARVRLGLGIALPLPQSLTLTLTRRDGGVP